MNQKRLFIGVGAVIIFILLVVVSTSYSSNNPSPSQYQSKVEAWNSELEPATQITSDTLTDGTALTSSNLSLQKLSDLEDKINQTNPPAGYGNFHSYLQNEVINFGSGYDLEVTYRATGDQQALNLAKIYFAKAHQNQSLANTERQKLNF